jgi:uncharacterized membrane protein YphA (DoxX/SURF4 family)
MSTLLGWLVINLVVMLFLFGVILVVWPIRMHAEPLTRTKILLVFLRLAIAWHFFIEGMDKLHHPSWTSENYLRESTGPLAPTFRALAGDRLVERLQVNSDHSMSDVLDQDWKVYLDAVQSFYGLNAEQRERMVDLLRQVKEDTGVLLAIKPKEVEKISPYPPPLRVSMTMPERLEEYRALKKKVLDIEQDQMVHYGEDAFENYKTAKANANKWRADLQKDLNIVNKRMKRAVQTVLLEIAQEEFPGQARRQLLRVARATMIGMGSSPYFGSFAAFAIVAREEVLGRKIDILLQQVVDNGQKEIASADPKNWEEIDRIQDRMDEKTLEIFRTAFFAWERENPKFAEQKSKLASLIITHMLERRPKGQSVVDPLPFNVTPPVTRWTMLEWSDFLVKYGILAVGLLLLVGLFTRTACVAGAGFLLLFFLAMPPLPGWPDSPRAEGHYLFINKNIIEMLALLVLATTPSGRWAGLDALVHFLNPFRWRRDATLVRID